MSYQTDTKSLILKVSLKLFAAKGFHATTVRDIANAIGIRQSALYNHFKNKEEIFEILLLEFDTLPIVCLFANTNIDTLHIQGKAVFIAISQAFKSFAMENRYDALWRLMAQEMYRHEQIRTIYHDQICVANIRVLCIVFEKMIKETMIVATEEPLVLAYQFFMPLLGYQMEVSLLKLNKKPIDKILAMYDVHVEHFWHYLSNNKE